MSQYRFERNSHHRDPQWFYPPPERGDRWVFIAALLIAVILLLSDWP